MSLVLAMRQGDDNALHPCDSSCCRLLIELSERTDSEGASSSPDFVLCIGDDRSDEDMFTAVEHVTVAANGLEEVRFRGRDRLDANSMGTGGSGL